jgi:hypothetical protein
MTWPGIFAFQSKFRKHYRQLATADRAKIGLDADGGLSVRVDSAVRILDVEELKAVVEQVAAATDEIYKIISPSLLSPSQ